MPKTLGEIAVEAGLVTKASAARAGKMAEEQKQPLVVMLVRHLGVNEVSLVAALRKQTRVPLIDPGEVQIDPEALRLVSRDICARLRVLPLGIATDGSTRVLRLAMADPTDTSAVLEIEALTRCEIDVSALPLSAIDELIDQGYRQVNTVIVPRPEAGHTQLVTSRSKLLGSDLTESEVSVTAQIPLSALQGSDTVAERLDALIHVLVTKGLLTDAELTEALRKLKLGG